MKKFNKRMWENVLSRRYEDALITHYKEINGDVIGIFEYEGSYIQGTFTMGFELKNGSSFINVMPTEKLAKKLILI